MDTPTPIAPLEQLKAEHCSFCGTEKLKTTMLIQATANMSAICDICVYDALRLIARDDGWRALRKGRKPPKTKKQTGAPLQPR